MRAHKPGALSRGNLFNLARAASRSDCWVPRSTLADKRIHQPKRHENQRSPTHWCRVTRACQLARCARERTFPMVTRVLVEVKCASECAHRSRRLAKPTVLTEGIVNETSSLPALRLFGSLAAPRARTRIRQPSQRARWVHSELAHGLAQSSNSHRRPVTRSCFASRLGMMLNNTRSPWGWQALTPRLLSENQKGPRPRVTDSVVTFESGYIPCGPRLLGSQD